MENQSPRRRRRTMRYENEASPQPSGRRMPAYTQEERNYEEEYRYASYPQQTENEESFWKRFGVGRWLIAILVVALVLALIWFLSRNGNLFTQQQKLNAPKDWATTTETATPTATLAPTATPTAQPTEIPTEAPTEVPTEEPTEAPTEESAEAPTEVPTEVPTMEPTVVPTEEPAGEFVVVVTETREVTFTPTEEMVFFRVIDGKNTTEVTLVKSRYAGGWMEDFDAWYRAEQLALVKEVPEAFGQGIPEEVWSARIDLWLEAACADPWTLTWFRFQMGLEDFKDMDEANSYARFLIKIEPEDYDEIANATLNHYYESIDGGSAKISPNWGLEVMMRWLDAEHTLPELFARKFGDINHKPDTLMTFYDRNGKNFVSYKKAFEVACKNARVVSGEFRNEAYVNFDEGGTWKWKQGAKPGQTPTPTPGQTPTPTPEPTPEPTPTPTSEPTPTPKPTPTPTPVPTPTPTPKPTPTPTPKPTPTPTPKPTPTPRPTKDPEQRPTVTDAPVGGGETNPQNSADPHTQEHTESTPAPPNPPTPAPTAVPTAVPTAEVRPTEVCEVPVATPIREDTQDPPAGDDDHNVPETETEGEADDSFDPDAI